jgi:hypothetical protein
VSRVKWEAVAVLVLRELLEAVSEWVEEFQNRARRKAQWGTAMGTHKAVGMAELSAEAEGLASEWARGLVENWGPEQALAMATHAVAELTEAAREAEKVARVEEQTLDLAGKRARGMAE